MGKTSIQWTDYSWNPVTGCTPVSEGCRNCYARRIAHRLSQNPAVPHRERYEGFRVSCWPERLEEPLRLRKPRRVFVSSMGDLFHEDVSDEFICRVFAVIALTPVKHKFLILTKRPHRMREFILGLPQRDETFRLWVRAGGEWPLSNLWLGVTAENQARADERIPILLQIPAAVRFVSCEPLLGPVDIYKYLDIYDPPTLSNPDGYNPDKVLLDWVICGGETGPGARPMHPDWVRSLRDQCQAAGVPFFFKSWGEWACRPWSSDNGKKRELCLGMDGTSVYAQVGHMMGFRKPGEALMVRVGKKAAGRLLDGQIWDQRPEVSP